MKTVAHGWSPVVFLTDKLAFEILDTESNEIPF
jgi:hypothetical protein